MSLFHSILAQIEQNLSKSHSNTEQVAAILTASLGTTITHDQISVKNGTAYIQASGTVKMALRFKKDRILKEFKASNIAITAIQ
jgi:hypothetical protein